MRLFLSSYRAGNHSDRLVELFGEGSEVGVITNGKDHKTPEEREASVDEILGFLSNLAMRPVEIDLRPYFQKPKDTEKLLRKFNALWLADGNTFILRKALAYSSADQAITKMLKKDKLAYGGESAGAIVATPSLAGVEFGDDPGLVPKGYKKALITEGLGLVNFHIVPHYKSEWAGARYMLKAIGTNGLEYKTLTNDQAIVMDGDTAKVLT